MLYSAYMFFDKDLFKHNSYAVLSKVGELNNRKGNSNAQFVLISSETVAEKSFMVLMIYSKNYYSQTIIQKLNPND